MSRAASTGALVLCVVGGCVTGHGSTAATARAGVQRVAARLAAPWRLALAPAVAFVEALPEPRCVATMRTSFHLRPRAVVASVGRELPAGTVVEVLALSSVRRVGPSGVARPPVLARVRVATSRQEGFAFVAPAQLDAGCALPTGARLK